MEPHIKWVTPHLHPTICTIPANDLESDATIDTIAIETVSYRVNSWLASDAGTSNVSVNRMLVLLRTVKKSLNILVS